LLQTPRAPTGISVKPFMSVSRTENWKPELNCMFMVSLQFLRQSAAMVPGPDWTVYLEKVASKRVLVPSICTSVLPAGQPLPRSEIPTILTSEGTSLGVTAPRAAEARLRVRVRIVVNCIFADLLNKGWDGELRRGREDAGPGFGESEDSSELHFC